MRQSWKPQFSFLARPIKTSALVLVLCIGRFIGHVVKNVLITKDEIEELMSAPLIFKNYPTILTRFSQQLTQNANSVGTSYASELKRRYR